MGRKETRPNQSPDYKFMGVEEIKNLPVHNIVDDKGCHLFMWTTHKNLPFSFDVMKAWGFQYHCCMTWDKTFGITPYSFMFSTEFCLYGQIPKKWIKPAKMGTKTLFTCKPNGHSKKPQMMRSIIEQHCGDLPRIELFARERTLGWDVWGNEVESDINLNPSSNEGEK